jgi:hypothetical protein
MSCRLTNALAYSSGASATQKNKGLTQLPPDFPNDEPICRTMLKIGIFILFLFVILANGVKKDKDHPKIRDRVFTFFLLYDWAQ